MAEKLVRDLVVPLAEGTPHTPAVTPETPLLRALRVMIDHGLRRIAVARRGSPIGEFRLEDALRALGLEECECRDP